MIGGEGGPWVAMLVTAASCVRVGAPSVAVGAARGAAPVRGRRLPRVGANGGEVSPEALASLRTAELVQHTASLRANLESLRRAQRAPPPASPAVPPPSQWGAGAGGGGDEVSRLREEISAAGGALEPLVSSRTARVLREAFGGGEDELDRALSWLRGKEEAERAAAQRLRAASQELSDAFDRASLSGAASQAAAGDGAAGGAAAVSVGAVKRLVQAQREAQDRLEDAQADVQTAIAACARLAAENASQLAGRGGEGSLQLVAAAEAAASALLGQEAELLDSQRALRLKDEAVARAEERMAREREELEQVRDLVAKQRSQLSTATSLLSEVQEALKATTGELKANKAEVERVKAELRAREAEFEKGKRQLKARTDLLESTLDTLEFRDDEMVELKKMRDNVTEEGSKLKVRNAALEEALAAMHSQLQTARAENRALSEQAMEAEDRAAAAAALAQEKDVLVKSLQQTLAAAKDEIRALVALRDSRRDEVQAAALKASALKHMGSAAAAAGGAAAGALDPAQVEEVVGKAAREVADILARREQELRRARELISEDADALASSSSSAASPGEGAPPGRGSLLEQVRASHEASKQLAAVKQRQLDAMKARITLIRGEREVEQNEINALRTELAAARETLKQKDRLQAYPFVPDDRGRLVMSLSDVDREASALKELLRVSAADPSRFSPREKEDLEAAAADALLDEHSENALFAHIDAVVAGGSGPPLGMRFNSTMMDTVTNGAAAVSMGAYIAALLADGSDGDAAAALAGAG